MKKEINLVVAIIIMIVVGGGAFYGGMQYQKSTTAKARTAFAGGARTGVAGQLNRNGANTNGARPVSGQIISSDDKSITVKLRDNSSKIVLFGSSTVINKSTTGVVSDLKNDEQVMVVGTANSDGSVTAQNINIQSVVPAGQ